MRRDGPNDRRTARPARSGCNKTHLNESATITRGANPEIIHRTGTPRGNPRRSSCRRPLRRLPCVQQSARGSRCPSRQHRSGRRAECRGDFRRTCQQVLCWRGAKQPVRPRHGQGRHDGGRRRSLRQRRRRKLASLQTGTSRMNHRAGGTSRSALRRVIVAKA